MPQPPQPPAQRPPETTQPQPPAPDPSPSPSSTTSPEAASAGSSTGSSADFLADPGPAFDPKLAPAAPEPEPEDEPDADEGWQEATIRDLLVTQGNATHWLLKAGPEDDETWKHTQDDLNAISRPLTRILNRYDVTRAAAAAGDEIALGAALTVYATRNVSKRRRYIAAQRAQEPQPLTGVAADEDLGPDHDAEWGRIHEPPPALVPKGARR